MPSCPHCGDPMSKKAKYEDNWLGCIAVMVAVGLGVFLSIVQLWCIGVPLVIFFLIMLPFAITKKQRLWRCPQCRVALPRY